MGGRLRLRGVVGFRAGRGLGNALFIATSLAVIVASSSGGFAGAIVLYEIALGVGIAAGPLVGGLLRHAAEGAQGLESVGGAETAPVGSVRAAR